LSRTGRRAVSGLDRRAERRGSSGSSSTASPGQNNGNRQWVASTGVDPAPCSRRTFNPVLQQRRHDPAGGHVRRRLPELREVPDPCLAEPWTMSDARQRAANCIIGRDYRAPVVDHALEPRAAIERYAAAAR
jgi:deoxyribodipyrimidine photo-lyase